MTHHITDATNGGREPLPNGPRCVLEEYIREKRKTKSLLLMTHLVIGYPSLEVSFQLAVGMVREGVDILELQIPFSEPMADGPVIVRANQEALKAGVTVAQCMEFVRKLREEVNVPLVYMSYCNILFKRGVGAFVQTASQAGFVGSIVPDLPPEEGEEYLACSRAVGIDPVLLVTPNTPVERIAEIDRFGSGMLYLVARKGVTGGNTQMSDKLEDYLATVRSATSLPLALGFGLKTRSEIDFLRGRVDVAIVGSAGLTALNAGGVDGALEFIRTLTS